MEEVKVSGYVWESVKVWIKWKRKWFCIQWGANMGLGLVEGEAKFVCKSENKNCKKCEYWSVSKRWIV